MEPHQQHVIEEKEQLDEKIEKLNLFLNGDSTNEARQAVSPEEADRMQRQLDCMVAYSGILGERITAFGSDTEPDETDSDFSDEEE